MSEITEPLATAVAEKTQIFVFDIKHNELKSSLSKVAHKECFDTDYKLPSNYSARIEREAFNVGAQCEFCGLHLNETEWKREQDALQKWLDGGDKNEYLDIKAANMKLTAQKTGSILPHDYKPEQVKTQFGTAFQYGKTETGRMSSREPNMKQVERPKSKKDAPKTIRATGTKTDGVTIVTHQEKSLADMSKLSDAELFGTE
jgi:DNA polymerase I-like protein with 3'-5' exonuclease and polymerase domains